MSKCLLSESINSANFHYRTEKFIAFSNLLTFEPTEILAEIINKRTSIFHSKNLATEKMLLFTIYASHFYEFLFFKANQLLFLFRSMGNYLYGFAYNLLELLIIHYSIVYRIDLKCVRVPVQCMYKSEM